MGMLGNLLAGFVGGQMATVVNHLIEEHGGVQGIVSQLEKTGLGAQVKSWVGTGANMPVNADQIKQALNPQMLEQIAAKFGLPVDQIAQKLSQVLPGAIDKLTPGGQIPPAK